MQCKDPVWSVRYLANSSNSVLHNRWVHFLTESEARECIRKMLLWNSPPPHITLERDSKDVESF